jgi:hypothetical protein
VEARLRAWGAGLEAHAAASVIGVRTGTAVKEDTHHLAKLLGLTAQLIDVGALGQRSGHGVSLTSLRSAAQAKEEATAITVDTPEVDSVLPADPMAPSQRRPSS